MTQNSVYRETVTVTLENGLHLVPCSRISQFAQRHQCDIRICKDEMGVDAKNIFDLMTLSAEQGTVLVLEASGDGASEAVKGLVSLFENEFEMDDEAD
jgi:phosphocarrier protein HPr